MKKTTAIFLIISFTFSLVLPVNLFAAAGSEAASGATISLNSQVDGALIFLDGKETGFITPLPGKINASPGFYKIKVQKEGYTTWRKEFLLSEGENLVLNVVMVPLDVTESEKAAFNEIGREPVYKRWWFKTLMLVAVVAAVGGGGSGDGGGIGSLSVSW